MKIEMIGRITDCVLLAYRVPAERVSHLVPGGLELVTWGRWAFWNVVACRVEAMRPTGFPHLLGSTYYHVAYRLYVRAQTPGETIEGLYFVHSDADKLGLCIMGNRATDFRFHKVLCTPFWGVLSGTGMWRDPRGFIVETMRNYRDWISIRRATQSLGSTKP